MLRFLCFRTFGHGTAAGMLALAAGCEHFDGERSCHTRAKISLSPLRHYPLPQSVDLLLQGFAFPSFFWGFIGGSRPSKDAAASPDNLKDKYRANEDGSKCGPGCLGRDSIANAAAAAGPAVVNIYVSRGNHGFWLGKSMGSGTIIDSDGTILTCAHIVVDFEGMRSISKGKVCSLKL
ncbi:putative protease Do-like 14 [Platanthera guangdongensis]|uniref:Protease Do-like 14 n=1 Tax=Platanthera guangdongensis TaxID=2320717 RepID=A0ABR2M0E5_9ASPA